mmetsp:Transcript_32951/g.77908  ORF Transcript_32951/g.77908 Transcript_32951/m.77908 type:complete len:231 (+) Transcript_32951:1326-2018(+)
MVLLEYGYEHGHEQGAEQGPRRAQPRKQAERGGQPERRLLRRAGRAGRVAAQGGAVPHRGAALREHASLQGRASGPSHQGELGGRCGRPPRAISGGHQYQPTLPAGACQLHARLQPARTRRPALPLHVVAAQGVHHRDLPPRLAPPRGRPRDAAWAGASEAAALLATPQAVPARAGRRPEEIGRGLSGMCSLCLLWAGWWRDVTWVRGGGGGVHGAAEALRREWLRRRRM